MYADISNRYIEKEEIIEMKIEVLYIDKDIIVVNKPSGVASSEERGATLDMMSMIRNYLHENNCKYEELHVVHRLDKPVAGVMVYALNKKAAATLSKDIATKETKKYYKAIITGVPENGSEDDYVEVENVLLRDAKSNMSKIVPIDIKDANAANKNPNLKDAKIAKLKYKVCNKFQYKNREMCVVDIELMTGRHHQIRVQFNGMGTPLYGDFKYNISAKENGEREGVALCAYRLSFKHPSTGKQIEFEIVPKNSIFKQVY